MLIDTRYETGRMICSIKLIEPDERSLGDDLVARVACNQHRLLWSDTDHGTAELGGKDPATFRFPSGYGDWSVTRRGLWATVTFKVPE